MIPALARLMRYTRSHESTPTTETMMSDTLAAPRTDLTRRERVVLTHLDEDTTLDDIATYLFVSRNTVKTQVSSIYRKLGISTRREAVARARDLGLRSA